MTETTVTNGDRIECAACGEVEMWCQCEPSPFKQTTEPEIAALRARVAELEAALRMINAHASPRAEGRTLDDLSGDLYWCACEARRALENDRG